MGWFVFLGPAFSALGAVIKLVLGFRSSSSPSLKSPRSRLREDLEIFLMTTKGSDKTPVLMSG